MKPDASIQRFLISSPSRLVGEYISDDLLISHAWQFESPVERAMENPFSKSYFVISVKVPDPTDQALKTGFVMYPRLSVETLLICLSLLYGKRFDDHGIFESFGLFRVPNINNTSEFNKDFKIGFINHQPRSNFSFELNFSHFDIMRPLFEEGSGVDERVKSIFTAAGKFYLQALQRYESQPDSAYLDLITCGEILSNFYSYSDELMYDVDLLNQFSLIESCIDRGSGIVRNIKKRLFQVSRRFRITLMNLLTPEFFENHEVESEYAFAALNSETIDRRINAAYQLRSSYVHTGKTFGRQIQDNKFEHQLGKYAVDNPDRDMKAFLEALNDAPTFKGLERLMRFCLLRFLEENKVIQFTTSTDSNY